MASPPSLPAFSPPPPSSLSLPRQRPTLSLPTKSALKRKSSIASATSSSHPLRQTSFPPTDRYGSPGGSESQAVYSPTDSAEISDSEITSAISGPAGENGDGSRKRKRGEKRNRGRPPKNPRGSRQDSQSLVNGTDEGRSRRNAKAEGDDIDDEDEDEDEDDGAAGTGRGNFFEQDRYIANDRARIDLHQQMPTSQQERHDSWHRAKLKTADVRKLVNQTLSQSVPANVVTVVQAYTKMFAGILIEGAREVQSEWMAVESKRADGGRNTIADHLQATRYAANGHGNAQTRSNGHDRSDAAQHDQLDYKTDPAAADDCEPSEALRLRHLLEESDRGPLLPNHLRESLRRFKKSRAGGVVGFTGLSLEGRDVAAARMGGRRLFH